MNDIQLICLIALSFLFLIIGGVVTYFMTRIDFEIGFPLGFVIVIGLALLLTRIVLYVGKQDRQDNNNGGVVIEV